RDAARAADRRGRRGHQDPLGLPAEPARRVTRRLAAFLLAAAALGASGCRDTADSTSTGGSTVTVYSLLPLVGPSAATARDIVDGEKLALRDARGQAQAGKITVNFRSVDSTDDGRLTAATAARAARTVAQDPSAVAAI